MGNTALANGTKARAELINVGSRLEIAQLKKLIHESGVCVALLNMAVTGKRLFGEAEEEIPLQVHIDLMKFMANKVLPNARDMGEAKSDAQQALWAEKAKHLQDGEFIKKSP